MNLCKKCKFSCGDIKIVNKCGLFITQTGSTKYHYSTRNDLRRMKEERNMATCEKCWQDAYSRSGGVMSQYDYYETLLEYRDCTPEEQAGEKATKCSSCGAYAVHVHTKQCLNCGKKQSMFWEWFNFWFGKKNEDKND